MLESEAETRKEYESRETREDAPENDREYRGMMILDIVKNSPASRAGLRAGDIILKINGESFAGTEWLAKHQQKTENAPSVFEGVRNGKIFSATIAPEYSEVYKRKAMGFLYEDQNFVFHKENNETKITRRISGEWKDKTGKANCRYQVEVDTNKYEMQSGKEKFPAFEIKTLQLFSEKKPDGIDVMERFSSGDAKAYWTPSLLSAKFGYHDPNKNEIVLGSTKFGAFSQVGLLGTLLHEMRHGEQREEGFAREAFRYYALHQRVNGREMDQVTERQIYSMEEALEPILAIYPREAKGVDFKNIAESWRESCGNWVATLYAKEAARNAANHQAKTAIQAMPKLKKFFERQYLAGDGSKKLPEETARWIRSFLVAPKTVQEIPEPMRNAMPLGGIDKYPIKDFRIVMEAIVSSPKDIYYNEAPGGAEIWYTFTVKELEYDVSLRFPIAPNDAAAARESIAKWKEKQEEFTQRKKEYIEAREKALGLEIKPGATARNFLSLPGWEIERDADVHMMKNLRKLREELGVNLFKVDAYSAEHWRAEVKEILDNPLLRSRYSEDNLKMLEQRLAETEKIASQTIANSVKDHMRAIGVSAQSLRALRMPSRSESALRSLPGKPAPEEEGDEDLPVAANTI